MSRLPAQLQTTSLHRHEGLALLSAAEVILKSALESESEVTLITGSHSDSLGGVFESATMTGVGQLLHQHGLRCLECPMASRALELAMQTAQSGRAAISMVPNHELDFSQHELGVAASKTLDRGGALAIILEDDPHTCPASCPRRACQRVSLTAIEPGDLGQLRDSIEQALRLSRASRSPVAIVVHSAILRSMDTLELQPNRIMGPSDSAAGKRRRIRSPRWSETGGMLRMARRMELNRFRAMPSPGERVSVGFIAVGPANGAIGHLANVLGLFSRVPVLQLGLINPVDEPAVERLLERCQQVIVLEPRPGTVEMAILSIAEGLRRRGEEPATIWGRVIPPDGDRRSAEMKSDDDLHPSVLVRKISHLLHALRPASEVAAQLVPESPPLATSVQSRAALIGSGAATVVLRRMATDVDQWLRESAPLGERSLPATALAIDGQEPPGDVPRIVNVEIWEHERFLREGLAAMVQAAREVRPWLFMVCEDAGEDLRDLERLARGAVPAERADRVALEVCNLNDRAALRDLMREAVLQDRMTVMVVRDGPPAQFDVSALERVLTEIDLLGFEPRQAITHSAEDVCDIRPSATMTERDAHPGVEHDSMRSSIQIEPVASSRSAFVRIRPLVEEVEVIRTRPPAAAWKSQPALKLPVPQLVHGRQPHWRAHCAGVRGEMPGVASRVLCEAGRAMGYRVQCVHQTEPIGPGMRAWAQVLFSNPREGEHSPGNSPVIPFGEADLLLGLDARETLRAIGDDPSLRVAFADRTTAVINVGSAVQNSGGESWDVIALQTTAAVQAVTRNETRLVEDVSTACRTWFHTDRMADMVLLGAAYQLGLIPVTAEAIETAVQAAEARGLGRSSEAFEFGRHVAVDRQLLQRPHDHREEDVERLMRRMVLSVSRGGWGGGSRARHLASLLEDHLTRMPGLSETDAGRQARREFIMAVFRCLIWGGMEYAAQYADLIMRLYRADRGDRGRMLCRNAVLPLAEAMLIRDPIYIASMACSAEQRRRTRLQLNVKEARGDRIERRYLTRIDAQGFGRRLRADLRTSDWPARILAAGRRLMPKKWRGTVRERELRDYLCDVVRRATQAVESDYDRWAEALLRLHNQAAENRLRDMAIAEVRMLVEPGAIAPAVTATAET